MERVGNCQTCGVAFEVKPGTVGKYCSHKCSYARKGNRGRCGRPGEPKVLQHCPVCGAGFEAFASRVKIGRGKFCSKACYNIGSREIRSVRRCAQCGKVVMVLPYRQKRKSFLCSRTCRDQRNKTGQYVTCENQDCGKIVYRSRCNLAVRKHFFCSIRCRSAVVHGERHHLWEGGVDPDDKRREHEFTSHQRRRILERDEYACRACGDEQAEELHIDHVLAICLGGTADIENGQTLCARCHHKKTASDRAKNRERKMRVAG